MDGYTYPGDEGSMGDDPEFLLGRVYQKISTQYCKRASQRRRDERLIAYSAYLP